MMQNLTTVWEENMDRTCPWSDYPRPLLVRDSYFSLNGEWDFAYSKDEPRKYTEKILVPFPPESRLSGIERGHSDDERLFYRRKFTLPIGFLKDKLVIHFGAVDQTCEVILNSVKIGSNEGGYIPFSFDITEFIREGENEICVIATDTLSPLYPYGKQKKKRGGMWYTPVSGIWQSVWIESLTKNCVEDITVSTDTKKATVELKSKSKNARLTLLETGEVFEFDNGRLTVAPKNPILWTPESPYLYHFTVETEDDKIESYFALREIGTEKIGDVTRLTLNGKPYLFHGLLDQGYFPDGIFLPATSEGYENDIMTAKALGFNMLRKHIKIEPQIFYYLCDKLGMVVFQDMINNSDYSFIRDTALPTVFSKKRSDKKLHKNPKSREIFLEHMEQTMSCLHNHPSILYYTIFNEGWGQFCADDAFKLAKSIDSSRIIDATSGWFIQNDSDVDSHHVYFKPIKLKCNPDRPIVISEFGGYSHRCEGHLFGDKNYGYRSFKERADFEKALTALYENEVLPHVKMGVSALVYTQLSDVEDETNGFMTYDRRVMKVNVDDFFKLSQTLKENIL